MSEEKLEKEFEVYRALAKEDKKIDVASLMINALHKHEANLIEPRQKRWAYILSLMLPPIGFIFALRFYFMEKDDATQTAIICFVLTLLSVFISLLFGKLLLSTIPQ